MKKVFIILFLIILIFGVTLSFSSCDYKAHKASSINLALLDENEFNKMELEEKGDNKLELICNSVSSFCIVFKEGKSRSLIRAVSEMQDLIAKISGASIPIVKEKGTYSNAIYVYYNSNLFKDVYWDGFQINIDENIHLLANGELKVQNAIYYFLEEYLGVVFTSPYDTFIPKHNSIYLDKGSKSISPKTEWRTVSSYEAGENYWAAKLKLNGVDVNSTDEEVANNLIKDGVNLDNKRQVKINSMGRQHYDWYGWCHSMYKYLSPEEYFDTHPEYFCMKNGKRVHKYKGQNAHLCLSNPMVYKIVEEKMAKLMEEYPEKKYWDFSANDNYRVKGCQCDECKKLDKEAGGTGMGTLLPFINKLAKRFPDKYISTLAYFHTLKAPKNIKAEPNVIIKVCAMPGDQGTSYLNPGNNNAENFRKTILEWKEITDKIIVWDYTVNYNNLLVPFPNFGVQVENQKFYEENKVQSIFHQASRDKGGESAMIRNYILAKLMWEGSSMDLNKEMSRYIMAYYGAAAKDIIDYYNLVSLNLAESSSKLGLYDHNMKHFMGYLSKDNINAYNDILNRALKNADKDLDVMERIFDLKMNVIYAKMLLPDINSEDRQDLEEVFDLLVKFKKIENIEENMTYEQFKNSFVSQVAVNKVLVGVPFILAVAIGGLLCIIAYIIERHRYKKREMRESVN